MKPNQQIAVGSTTYVITLNKLKDHELYRWQRNDGEWVSPIFTTLQEALFSKCRMLPDSEWKQLHPDQNLTPANLRGVPTVNEIGIKTP